MSRGYPSNKLELSVRQLQFLGLLASGHSCRSAAESMGVSPRTCEEYSWEARSKLGARTTEHAVAIAIRKGLIT